MRLFAALALLPFVLIAVSCRGEPPRDRMGLFTTLPIYWSEAHDIAGMLSTPDRPHWARDLIEQRYAIAPLDTLEDDPLARLNVLLLAQPRALSPQENVTLDGWVRQGGRLLLFADPLLTAHSKFALGDKRRPQDVVLLSPLLTHWGLSFHFDDRQPPGVRIVDLLGGRVPVDMAGQFTRLTDGPCVLLAAGLAADCAIGKGKVLVIADAALLDGDAARGESREAALAALLAHAFDR